MIIRKAKVEDLDEIMRVMDAARKHMEDEGNTGQWIDGYPSRELITSDIEKGEFYVWADKDADNGEKICGGFAFIIGEDPTYIEIENGKWLNDKPYGTIHRIGSDGIRKGMLRECLAFCKTQIPEIRMDTHEKNISMQSACERLGFVKCGTIHISDGSSRIAYQLCNGEK